MKLFFKRAPEVQKMLGRLLKVCLEDTSSAAVHDRCATVPRGGGAVLLRPRGIRV